MGILRTDKISGLETPTAVTGSVEFGDGNALQFPAGGDFAYGTGDFTIEGWFYQTALADATNGSLFFSQTVGGTNYLLFGVDVDGKLFYVQYNTGGNSTSLFSSAPNGSVVLNQWQHIAFVRSGNRINWYTSG